MSSPYVNPGFQGRNLSQQIESVDRNVQRAFTDIYGQTSAEASAGVTPTAFRFPAGHAGRYMTDAQRAGTADAAPALTEAFTAVQVGGRLFIPSGIVLDTQVLCERGDIEIFGDRGPITVTPERATLATFFQIKGANDSNRIENIILRDLYFVGDFSSSLADFYASLTRAGRFNVQFVDKLTALNLRGHRISIVVDARDCDHVTTSNIASTESGNSVSIIRVQHASVTHTRGVEMLNSAVDLSQCDGVVVDDVYAYASDAGDGVAAEAIDMGSCHNIILSNIVSRGFNNVVRCKMETTEAPYSNIQMRGVNGRDFVLEGIVLQASLLGAEPNCHDIHMDGVILRSSKASSVGVRQSGQTEQKIVSLRNFDIDVTQEAISLRGCSDVTVHSGRAKAGTSDPCLHFGEDVADSAAGDRVSVQDVEIDYSGSQSALRIANSERPTVRNVKIVQSGNDGVLIDSCQAPRVRGVSGKNIDRHGVHVIIDDTDQLIGDDVLGASILDCEIEDWGKSSSTGRGVFLQIALTDEGTIKGFRVENNTLLLTTDHGSISSQIGVQVNGGSGTTELAEGRIVGNLISSNVPTRLNTSNLGDRVAVDELFNASNVSERYSYDADSTSTAQLADVLGTLLRDLGKQS